MKSGDLADFVNQSSFLT